MARTVKKGMTFRVRLELDPEEWEAIYPWGEILCHARRDRTAVAHPLIVTTDPDAREIWLFAETRDWPIGQMQFDILIDGVSAEYLPPASFMSVEVIHPATERPA